MPPKSDLLRRVTTAMEAFAPLRLADSSWDNVGTLVENPAPNGSGKVFLTIDLTPSVLKEALGGRSGSCDKVDTLDAPAEVIVSYHPPIFVGMKRLVLNDPKQKIVLDTVVAGASIFSPHTSLDAAKGGINDWLCDSCAPLSEMLPITQADKEEDGIGMGRIGRFKDPLSLTAVLDNLKKALGVPTCRVALPTKMTMDSEVSSVAVCAGSGSSVLRGLKFSQKVQLLVTGEMGHHEVLAAVGMGRAVFLFEHTNSERGFLKAKLQPYLQSALGQDVQVVVSELDADPLVVY